MNAEGRKVVCGGRPTSSGSSLFVRGNGSESTGGREQTRPQVKRRHLPSFDFYPDGTLTFSFSPSSSPFLPPSPRSPTLRPKRYVHTNTAGQDFKRSSDLQNGDFLGRELEYIYYQDGVRGATSCASSIFLKGLRPAGNPARSYYGLRASSPSLPRGS